MKCDKCKVNEASYHFTQMINDKKTESHLCQSCASEINPLDFDVNLNNMLQGFFNNFTKQATRKTEDDNVYTVKCEVCNTTLKDIRNTGKIGCPNCYDVFSNELKGVIKNIQGTSEHIGKFPQKADVEMKAIRKVEELQKALKEKIKNEEYEDAARLRDEIKALKGEI